MIWLPSHFQRPQKTLNLLVKEERYSALFHMPLYKFLHNLLYVLVQIANKIGLHKKTNPFSDTMVLKSTPSLTEVSDGNLSGSKARPALKTDKVIAICVPIV
jgi:hypothetical protein